MASIGTDVMRKQAARGVKFRIGLESAAELTEVTCRSGLAFAGCLMEDPTIRPDGGIRSSIDFDADLPGGVGSESSPE